MDTILGVEIDKVGILQVLDSVKKAVETNKKLHIVTLNTELLIASERDKKLRNIINQSGIRLPESSGLYLADNYFASEVYPRPLRLLTSGIKTIFGARDTLPEKVSGVDLCYKIAELCLKEGYNLLLLGGRDGVAKEASRNLKKLYPGLNVVGVHGGKVTSDKAKILSEVEKAKTDIIFVAFGQPAQEFWIAENLGKLNTKVAVGVGGTLDFMSGRVPRAPEWVRKLGLEWLFRLFVQPWRIKRQFALIKFIFTLLKTN